MNQSATIRMLHASSTSSPVVAQEQARAGMPFIVSDDTDDGITGSCLGGEAHGKRAANIGQLAKARFRWDCLRGTKA